MNCSKIKFLILLILDDEEKDKKGKDFDMFAINSDEDLDEIKLEKNQPLLLNIFF